MKLSADAMGQLVDKTSKSWKYGMCLNPGTILYTHPAPS
jgi:hypothetical protein